jgi:hypothetical protein
MAGLFRRTAQIHLLAGYPVRSSCPWFEFFTADALKVVLGALPPPPPEEVVETESDAFTAVPVDEKHPPETDEEPASETGARELAVSRPSVRHTP